MAKVNKLSTENQSVGKLPTEISLVNCGKMVGKVEGNLQSKDEIPTKFCRQSVGNLPTKSPLVFCW